MLVYTQQPFSVWQQVYLTGVYYPMPGHESLMKNIDNNWKLAYNWMTNQLASQVSKPKKATLPIWWWPITKNYFPKCDPSNVTILAEIPKTELLASNFELWHFVLNRFYLHSNQNETEDEWNQTENQFDSLPAKKQHQLMLQSWQHIFDLKECHDYHDIQLVSWNIQSKHVFRVLNYQQQPIFYHQPNLERKLYYVSDTQRILDCTLFRHLS